MGRMPLRTRVMAWFGLVSVLVTSLLAVLTWLLSTGYMLDQRERGATRQAQVNARLVEGALRQGSAGLGELLTGLGSDVESAVLLVDDGQWRSSGNLVDPTRLPPALLATVQNGQAALQRTRLDGVPVLAVALPLPAVSATYVEVFPLREIDRTFRFLSWMLIAATVTSGVAGALLGRWAATHSLRPLDRLTAAAAVAAGGDLSARLPETRDPDLVRLATAFNDTAERLQQRVARDARFAGDVSHELRSPLTTMLNAMAVLDRRRAELTPSARQAVELLGTDLRRFRRMVDDLLEISRADHDRDQLSLEPVDLAELAGQALGGHPAGIVDAVDHPQVLADRRHMERVVVNLVDNAQRHGRGLVRLGVLCRDGQARLEVDDAGPGVAPADRERVFERFARGSPADRDDSDSGVGLGLALVAQHVHRHDGRAWVEDRPGGGARFVVELPQATP
ncbi:HAMP domain-containing sensor histidine kinase [Actinophytocola sp.]|uniref:HAMP domain-containing sensor histidine kinase n=1 Tax=Actinophytocola sp. TaxID=1872138 RepID=UPI002D7FF866|nr:ATP-binding protein [Actinophytocola sp.]HET9142695.1 ATP-binding protein [Actinophytocola sp.]